MVDLDTAPKNRTNFPFKPKQGQRDTGLGPTSFSLDDKNLNKDLKNTAEEDPKTKRAVQEVANDARRNEAAREGAEPVSGNIAYYTAREIQARNRRMNFDLDPDRGQGTLKIDLGGGQTINVKVSRTLSESQLNALSDAVRAGAADTITMLSRLGLTEGAQFNNLRIHGSFRNKVDLTMLVLKDCTFNNCDFTHVDLDGSNMEKVKVIGGRITGSSLMSVVGQYCKFVGVDMRGSDFRGAAFVYSDLDPSSNNMRNTDLRGTIFIDGTMLKFLADNGSNQWKMRKLMRGCRISDSSHFFWHLDPDDVDLSSYEQTQQKGEALRDDKLYREQLLSLCHITRDLPWKSQTLKEGELGEILAQSTTVISYEMGSRDADQRFSFMSPSTWGKTQKDRILVLTKKGKDGRPHQLVVDFNQGYYGQVGLFEVDDNGEKIEDSPINKLPSRVVDTNKALREIAKWLGRPVEELSFEVVNPDEETPDAAPPRDSRGRPRR